MSPCPKCGDQDAYIGLAVVECPSAGCVLFSQKQYDAVYGVEKTDEPLFEDDTPESCLAQNLSVRRTTEQVTGAHWSVGSVVDYQWSVDIKRGDYRRRDFDDLTESLREMCRANFDFIVHCPSLPSVMRHAQLIGLFDEAKQLSKDYDKAIVFTVQKRRDGAGEAQPIRVNFDLERWNEL